MPCDGTIQKRVEGVSDVGQDKDPEYNGPYITDDDFSGRSVHTTTCLEPGVAEVLSSEMSHGMSQIGVPHFTHAMRNAVCDGVDTEAHKIIDSRHVNCCCERTACYHDDQLDLGST